MNEKLLTFITPDPTNSNSKFLFWFGTNKMFLEHPIEYNYSEIIILSYVDEDLE